VSGSQARLSSLTEFAKGASVKLDSLTCELLRDLRINIEHGCVTGEMVRSIRDQDGEVRWNTLASEIADGYGRRLDKRPPVPFPSSPF
jgi:hypothetical protein